MTEIRRFGFWHSERTPSLPHPKDFVQSWEGPEREEVVYRLSIAEKYESYAGFSYCRLCGEQYLGTEDHTGDWTWIWPEGLLHYITEHSLKPSQEFIDHVLSWSGSVVSELSRYKTEREALKRQYVQLPTFCESGCEKPIDEFSGKKRCNFRIYPNCSSRAPYCQKNQDAYYVSILEEDIKHYGILRAMGLPVPPYKDKSCKKSLELFQESLTSPHLPEFG